MDTSKRNQLIQELSAEPEPQIVSIERFFDGNDDLASIGCNLLEHPGIDVFRDILVGLSKRSDVEGAYAQIAELDPGEDFWPFADTVFIAGTIATEELRMMLAPLEPDEVGPAESFGVPELVRAKHKGPILVAWWD